MHLGISTCWGIHWLSYRLCHVSGLPKGHISYVRNIKEGLPLFLFNYDDRRLYGIYEAAGNGKFCPESNAWSHDSKGKTSYPAQVQSLVSVLWMSSSFSLSVKWLLYSCPFICLGCNAGKGVVFPASRESVQKCYYSQLLSEHTRCPWPEAPFFQVWIGSCSNMCFDGYVYSFSFSPQQFLDAPCRSTSWWSWERISAVTWMGTRVWGER